VDEKVSVIIPVYNAEKYLERCIKAVVGQTYENLEIILVDDGSTDNSGKICDRYSESDDRIKVIHQKNQGQSAARNNAIECATGKYYVFVDSDDSAPFFMVDKLVQSCIKNNCKVSIGDFSVFTGDEPETESDTNDEFSKIISGTDAITMMHTVPGEKYVVMWGKAFESTLFDGIRFPEGRICEDLAVLYRLYDKAGIITIINDVVYRYFRGNEDSSTFLIKDKFYKDVYLALDEEIAYMEKAHPELSYYPKKTYMYWIFDEYKKQYASKNNVGRLKQLHKKYTDLYKSSDVLPKEKFYHVFRYLPNLYCMIKK
jgi:glycosyltransferase involved in cell wall biosynthesis